MSPESYTIYIIQNTRITGEEISGYLTRLDVDYNLIPKKQPIFERTSNKKVRYSLNDNFVSFRSRFIFKYSCILEINGIGNCDASYNGIILCLQAKCPNVISKIY